MCLRRDGQGTEQEVRSRDFRRDLEDREHQSRDKRSNRNRESSSSSSSKKPRMDQISAANLDADDPIDDDVRGGCDVWTSFFSFYMM